MHACRFHDGDSSCRVAAGVPGDELSSLLLAGGALDQERCPLLDGLLREIGGGQVDWRSPRERGEGLSELYVLLLDVAETAGASSVNRAYLRNSASNFAIDRGRRSSGRVRCGSCRHYAFGLRLCTRQGAPYAAGTLEPDAHPKRLHPPCEYFASRRAPADEVLAGEQAARSTETSELVWHALEILRREHRAWTALLEEYYFLKRSLRELAQTLHCDRRWLARELERAEQALGDILEDLI